MEGEMSSRETPTWGNGIGNATQLSAALARSGAKLGHSLQDFVSLCWVSGA
jgi:hypothetical protein